MGMWRKRIIPSKVMMISLSVGGFVCGMYGIAVGNVHAARQYLQLTGSPLATEIRYQLRKINPSHPFLKLCTFEDEMEEDIEQNKMNEIDAFDSGYEQYGNNQYTDDSFFKSQNDTNKQT